MQDETILNDDILAQLRQEFIESARDQLDDIETKLDQLADGTGIDEKKLLGIQRHIHNIKGQGATFGFPLLGRVAHMLEDYLENTGGVREENIADIRVYLNLMTDLISTNESIVGDTQNSILNSLPTGQLVTFSTQQTHNINVLLVMPSGLQRKMVARELLSCGFRVMRAYDGLEALSIAVDLTPDIVFVNYDMRPFNGRELSNMFAAVDVLRDIHFVLLTSYQADSENLQDLPENISVVQKSSNFTESIGELLIQWGVFGNIPEHRTDAVKAISRHPRASKIDEVKTQRPLKILAAEDNPVNQQLIKVTIEAFGHQLEIVENGLLAVDAIVNGDFDLVFMDVNMPEMNGPEATRTIRQLPGDRSKTPVIAVTADAMESHRREYFESGMNECVGKPIDRAELLAAINTVMNEEIHVWTEIEKPENETDAAKDSGAPEEKDDDIEAFMKKLQDVSDKHDKKKRRPRSRSR